MNVPVLLIEDDLLLVKMYSAKFKAEGIPLAVASDGEMGLRDIIEKKPSVVILDVMMPKLSGIEVLKRLQESGSVNPKIVVMSNLMNEKEKVEALGLGASEYLMKTEVTPGELVEKIRKYL